MICNKQRSRRDLSSPAGRNKCAVRDGSSLRVRKLSRGDHGTAAADRLLLPLRSPPSSQSPDVTLLRRARGRTGSGISSFPVNGSPSQLLHSITKAWLVCWEKGEMQERRAHWEDARTLEYLTCGLATCLTGHHATRMCRMQCALAASSVEPITSLASLAHCSNSSMSASSAFFFWLGPRTGCRFEI